MPVYEYACKACGQHLEVVQSFKDEALTTCPSCGGALRKVFGSIGISFKGSGFYRTDSRPALRSKDKDGEKADSGDKSDTDKSDTREKAGDKAAKGEKTGKSEKAASSGSGEKSSSGREKASSGSSGKGSKPDAKTA
ncbi:MAG: FmdB family transcriptional regulator [Actinobacteria bacterium]|nr:FmdB family transcriptional regulator [Actinomycetota bacterium]